MKNCIESLIDHLTHATNEHAKAIEEIKTMLALLIAENETLSAKNEKMRLDNYCLRMQLENSGIKIIEENKK